MDDKFVSELSVPENVTKTLLLVSNSASLEKALEKLIEIAKVPDRRFDLSTKSVVTAVLQLCRSLSSPSWRYLLLLSLKALRNMCAGGIRNQNAFLEQRGVETVMDVITSVGLTIDPDCEIIRVGVQLLGNYSVAGREHQCDVWYQLFPHSFLKIAGVRSREICDPLCMVIYTCCEVGLREDWLKLLLSKICIEGSYFSSIFFKLHSHPCVENNDIITHLAYQFVSEQAHLLSILSEILNEQLEHIVVSHVFALRKDDLPTGSAPIDVLGYSLVILRDICACGHLASSKEEGPKDVVDILVSCVHIELLLDLLRNLEPPTRIRKAMTQDQIKEAATSSSLRCCPYKGFRRDIVAVLGNCAYRRRHIQDEIRDKKWDPFTATTVCYR
ncbi:uncharacterized protein [Nicotiana sylvestris]|uniref:uncharacterized protein n=1 Tax=Nicotiana sylvestris TaxID=4096 RepID=UPI00388C8DBA